MHGLINYSIEVFVKVTFGTEKWHAVTRKAGLPFVEFESMTPYEDAHTHQVLDAMVDVLDRSRIDLLEDFGAFLVLHPGFEAVRRLLRFGGESFVDFLHSLDDLADSARLAIPGLHLPQVELLVAGESEFNLTCDARIQGYGFVMMGVLRAMADDYGALAFLEHRGELDGVETVNITLIESDFAEGRSFNLAANFG